MLMISSVASLVMVPAFALAAMKLPAGKATTNTATATSAQIACVGRAVATREAALGAAVATHANALKAAYSTRATELAGAYSNTTAKTLQAGVKVSWADFNKSVKVAATAWKASRDAVWSAFKTAVKACKATGDVTDSTNSSKEVSGQ